MRRRCPAWIRPDGTRNGRVDMVNPDSGAIISAQPRDPRGLAEHICRDTFGANAQVDIAAIPNSRHLMFRVLTGGNQYALKVICGEHAAWHAEILARKLFADPAVPRIAFSGRTTPIDYASEWVDGGSLAELLVEPNHPTVPVAFARASALLAQIHSLDVCRTTTTWRKPRRPHAASGSPISSTILLTRGSYPTGLA